MYTCSFKKTISAKLISKKSFVSFEEIIKSLLVHFPLINENVGYVIDHKGEVVNAFLDGKALKTLVSNNDNINFFVLSN